MSSLQAAATTLDRTRELPGILGRQEGFADAVAALCESQGRATFDGTWGSSRALLTATLAASTPNALLVVCPRPTDADVLCDDLELFSTVRPEKFPAWESEPGERIIHDDIYGNRLRTLKHVLRSDPAVEIIVASIQSLLQPSPSRDVIASNSRLLKLGDRIDVEKLLKWLAEQHFHHTSAVELPGEFSVRGGIIDAFAPDWDRPVRIELFDDQVDSIRRFDVSSQRSLERLPEIELTILEPSARATAHLSEHLPASSCVLLIEPEKLDEEGQQYLRRLDHPESFHSVSQVFTELGRFSMATAAGMSSGAVGNRFHLNIESVERFSGEVGRVRDELQKVAADNEAIIVASTEAEVERLDAIFGNSPIAMEGRLQFVVGQLDEGFRLVREQLLLISANQMFQRGEVRRISRRRLGKAIDSFVDLREGDLVVHLSHGIGRYRGISLIDKQGQVEEHLQIEFHGGAKLYVPASRIELVQKYVGGSRSRPSLARLGGAAWGRQKKAAESAVMDMAVEMLELQAERLTRPGIPFGPDGEWQREFDSSFTYQETDDQLLAIRDIKQDMEQSRPMDRLLCGDVGFGKTEMAMRAAFKAVDNGFQVAILVPTTVLAEQHYHTFSERMIEFPFDIARLSRFCSGREQREIVQRLSAGQVDIVIGTHRLASRDVNFANLGLVIIDEEQRFGVNVKERLKTLRTEVDVLTMTATPIPRTLHMSLVGVRDISNLETPPEDRVAVETRVTRFSNELIRHAIMRELNRGGQVFFVHNRVQDIEILATKLRQIVPEATLAIAHGQMHEDQLEKVMVGFVAGEFDILLATTIVESGLDIPNANTIFIDEADRYGLADLHQLRGRVGRYKHRAYCYLLVDQHKHVTPNAARRLRAIEEYSEMGAGFALAMRDLEIRGAGNLLGMQQSGHIAAVGYEFYCQLLENAVQTLKTVPRKLSIDVDIDLPGEAYLPDTYVDDMRLKIDLYRRLRRAETYEQIGEFRDELVDRFGEPPEPVVRMMDLAELRMDATIWQIQAIYPEEDNLVFEYADGDRISQLARNVGRKLRVVDGRSAYLKVREGVRDSEAFFAAAKSVLQPK